MPKIIVEIEWLDSNVDELSQDLNEDILWEILTMDGGYKGITVKEINIVDTIAGPVVQGGE